MYRTTAQEIAEERERQDAKWGGADHDDGHAPADWRAFIEKKLAQANAEPISPVEYRRRMIQVAALAVAAIESNDRRMGWLNDQEPDHA